MMAIRLATVADVPRMHQIRTSVRENRLSHPDRVRLQDYVTLLSGAGRGWIAERDDVTVAFGIVDPLLRNVWALFVAPEFERQGLGRALLETMTDWLFEQGDGPVWLTTAPGTRAEQFYRTAGWRETGRRSEEIRFELTRPPARPG